MSSTDEGNAPSTQAVRRTPGAVRTPAASLLFPSLAFYTALLAIPFLGLVVMGFLTTSQSGLFKAEFTLSNYVKVLLDTFYISIIWTTLRLSIETTALCLLFGYPVAFWLAEQSPRTRKIVILFLLFPLLLSTVIRIYGWIVVLGRSGLINQLLVSSGFVDKPVAFLYHETTVLLGMATILIPYSIVNITNTLITIDPALKEAGAIHGASPWRVFISVTLPLSRPGILSAMLIVFSVSMSTYLISLLLGGPRVKLLGNVVFDATSSFNWPLGAALAVVLVILTMISCSAAITVLSTDKQRGRQ